MQIKDFLPPPPWEGPPLPEAFLRAFRLTPERIKLVQWVNDLIRKRVAYGVRTETADRLPSQVIIWSNGSASWGLYYSVRKSGPVDNLDANEVLVVGATREDVTAIRGFLEPLPLYSGSFEARERGIFNPRTWLQGLYNYWISRGEA